MHCSPVYEFHDINAYNFLQIATELQKFGENIHWNLMIIPFCENLNKETKEKFTFQLLKWQKDGHNLYLHGYKHKANLNFKRSLFGRLALSLTNFEAEFAGLSKKDSEMLLGEALLSWKEFNVGNASGFVAPAWYQSKMLFNLCKNFGIENYNSRFFIWNKNSGSKFSVPFSTSGIPKILTPLVNICEKIYLKLYGIFNFLPTPRIVKHPAI